jgi:dihydroorotate dehydrogenase electron transfer subunit
MLASDSVQHGLNVTFLIGADSEHDLLNPGDVPKNVEIVVATNDGSRGHTGDVSDLIPTYARWADQVFTQETNTVYTTVKTILQPLRIAGKPSLHVAVEREMPCGFGVCLGCTVATRHGTDLACVRGPVFDADELV